MVCIVDRLSKKLNRKITSEQIWKHLKTMYNLKALDDLEPLPFPNDETAFSLPPELQQNMKIKAEESEDGGSTDSRRATPKPTAPAKTTNTNSERKKESSESRVQPKRTRGSMSAESAAQSSPTSTPPPTMKRARRI